MPVSVRRAVAVSRQRTENPGLARVASAMFDAELGLEVVASADDAAAELIASDLDPSIVVLVDASQAARSGGDPRLVRGLALDLAALRSKVPGAAPVVFAPRPPASVVIETMRAGAFDFVALDEVSDPGELLTALARAASEAERRARRRDRLVEMRGLADEFLRTLVKTERRTIDLEERVVQLANEGDESLEPEAVRLPSCLIVDDDEAILDLLVVELARRGLRTDEATTGAAAIEAVERTLAEDDAFDLILIDKNLPDIDGLQLIERIRALTDVPSFMIMTGYASAESAIEAADLGVLGYIRKPFDDLVALCRRIEDVAERTRIARREQRYLARIKQRHARFLVRYRALAFDDDDA